jgi:uncharacterized Zn finger protein
MYWKPYVSVAERRRNAEREMKKLAKKGHPVAPVVIEGRTIAKTFWGKSWCENLESYSDFANRLPRGRTYVRNGSVVDLQMAPGEVSARVSGSELYEIEVSVAPVPKERWEALCGECSAGIDSLVELLQGRFSKGVMERICRQGAGLFPSPDEIELSCSCPDWASMCKHVAAVLYGIGARLDEKPELLFTLRQVDPSELIARAGAGVPLSASAPAEEKTLASEDLSELFGIEIDAAEAAPVAEAKPKRAAKKAPKSRKPAAQEAAPVAEAKPKRAAKKVPKSARKPAAQEAKPDTDKAEPAKAGRRAVAKKSSGAKAVGKKTAASKASGGKRPARRASKRAPRSAS